MAIFTPAPHIAPLSFQHFDPSTLKRTYSRSKAKSIAHTLRKDGREEANPPCQAFHQGSEEAFGLNPLQTLQTEETGHTNDVEDIPLAKCGTSVYHLPSGHSDYQLDCDLVVDEGTDRVTSAISNAAMDCEQSVRLNGTDNEYLNDATQFQPNKEPSGFQEKCYDLNAIDKGECGKQHGDLSGAVEYAFSMEAVESFGCGSSSAEDDISFSLIDVPYGLPATRNLIRHSSIIDAAKSPLAEMPNVMLDQEAGIPSPAKRQRLADQSPQGVIRKFASPLKSSPSLILSDNVSQFRNNESPDPGGFVVDREGDGGASLDLPLVALRDQDDSDDEYDQGNVKEKPQAGFPITSLKRTEDEQGADRISDGCEANRQGSGNDIGKSFEDELSHNNESYSIPLKQLRRRKHKDWAPARRRVVSNASLGPLGCTKKSTRVRQHVESTRPPKHSKPGLPKTNRRPQSCSLQSSSPGKTTSGGTNVKDGGGLDMPYQITDLTQCAVPKGSSIITAIVRYRDSYQSLDPIALGHKLLGEEGKVIRMIQLSQASCVLLGYRNYDGTLDSYSHRSLDVEWMKTSHSDAAGYWTDNADDDDWDEQGTNGEESTKVIQRTHKPWLNSDELLLLSLKDKQGMEWEEICNRFPGRTSGAVKARYYMLHKKDY